MTDEAACPALCATCDGDGLDGSIEAARYYAYSGKLTNCPDCDGTGQDWEWLGDFDPDAAESA